jgi:hypothetical protein
LTPGGCPIWAAFVDMLHAVVQWFLCYFLEQERDRRGGGGIWRARRKEEPFCEIYIALAALPMHYHAIGCTLALLFRFPNRLAVCLRLPAATRP